ncbi:hypothetical protein V7201_03355 [Bacillus sp. JJ1122]
MEKQGYLHYFWNAVPLLAPITTFIASSDDVYQFSAKMWSMKI